MLWAMILDEPPAVITTIPLIVQPLFVSVCKMAVSRHEVVVLVSGGITDTALVTFSVPCCRLLRIRRSVRVQVGWWEGTAVIIAVAARSTTIATVVIVAVFAAAFVVGAVVGWAWALWPRRVVLMLLLWAVVFVVLFTLWMVLWVHWIWRGEGGMVLRLLTMWRGFAWVC